MVKLLGILISFLIPLESTSGEKRVAASPETAKKLIVLGCKIYLEKGAGLCSGFSDDAYRNVGVELFSADNFDVWEKVDAVLCVQAPGRENLERMKPHSLVVGLLAPHGNQELANTLRLGSLSALSLELLPRISRAQSADALSSQANIAGYKAVLLGAAALDRYFPMLMTAAGTVQPAKVVILGAGVAGLQAVATAKRLGAVVFVSDIRLEVKEQVESLGGRFITPPDMTEISSEKAVYAKQASEEFLRAQRQKLSDHLAEVDVAICTAQVPGKPAPKLISEDMLDRMRPGSVVVDIAIDQGGNCWGTKKGETLIRNGVKLIGASDLPSSVPNHASSLYARNLLALLQPFLKDGEFSLNLEDELIAGSLLSHQGEIRFPELCIAAGAN